jgi:hypothetical protein
MRYWWVNQGKTFREERQGGYLWSPKRKKGRDGKATVRNPFYEYMREVAPGDVVFSYKDSHIIACGIITSYCYESPKPDEFGKLGENWEQIGWRVDVSYLDPEPFKPKDHLNLIESFLTEQHSPLKPNGGGKEFYLTKISEQFAAVITNLLGETGKLCIKEANNLSLHDSTEKFSNSIDEQVEQKIAKEIEAQIEIPETTRTAIVKARIGQGIFREEVSKIEKFCRLTGVEDADHLIASHIKPWKDSDNQERLSRFNGLMLTPTADHLFDKGFISFSDTGNLIYATRVNRIAFSKMKIPEQGFNVGRFTESQINFLCHHRNFVLKKAVII